MQASTHTKEFKTLYGYTQAPSLFSNAEELKQQFEKQAAVLNIRGARFEVTNEGVRCDFETLNERIAWDEGIVMPVIDHAYPA